MTTKDIAALKRGIDKNQAMVVLSLKEWEKREKEMAELKDVMEAIIEGELELKAGKLRTFKEFLAAHHAKNK